MNAILTYPQLDAIRTTEPVRHTVEFERHLFFANGFCWARGIKTSLTIKGRNSCEWVAGHKKGLE